jgi:hypothetical protein
MEALKNLPPTTWGLVAVAIVLGWTLAWLFTAYRKRSARKLLLHTVTSAGSEYLADVLVPDGMQGFFHLDFVLLTPAAIVVVDLRDIAGNIFAGDQMNEWTVIDGSQRYTFVNPQNALYDRIAAVKTVVGDVPVEGRIAFTRNGKFPKGLPKWTVMVDALKTEFPSSTQTSVAAAYRVQWQRLRDAVTPSSMNQSRAL